ncbi:MAG: NADH-quinone oxidoreductase subunit B [Micrococcales bacterium]|nr:NADH-quinone oxidoreductase subunit B [Micrococcales bacterium]
MGLEDRVPAGILLTTVEQVVGWTRRTSLWPLTMGLACCAIEMISFGGPRADSGRWGQEVFRASPRQADLMVISGRVSQKMAPLVRRLYDQMPNPKWVVAMGACSSSGGIFNNYAIVQGVDHVVPVDIYVPGCPPRPDQLIDAVFKLKENEVYHAPIGANAVAAEKAAELAGLAAPSLLDLDPATGLAEPGVRDV